MSARSWEKRNILDGTTKKRSTKRYIAAAKSLCSTQIQIARNCIRESAYIPCSSLHIDLPTSPARFLAARSSPPRQQVDARFESYAGRCQPLSSKNIHRYIRHRTTGGRSPARFPTTKNFRELSFQFIEDRGSSVSSVFKRTPSSAGILQLPVIFHGVIVLESDSYLSRCVTFARATANACKALNGYWKSRVYALPSILPNCITCLPLNSI